MYSLSANALKAAFEWHEGQVRKYDGMPYIVHPVDVGARLWRAYHATPSHPCWSPNFDLIQAAAFLHDTIEDCDVNYADYEIEFGPVTTESLWPLVMEVTQVSKPSDGNRAHRKNLDKLHYAQSSPAGATIKLADMISNVVSIREAINNMHREAISFMPVYLSELQELLPHLKHGNDLLWEEAKKWTR